MSLSDKPYSVYIHTNRENGKVYIGITRQDPSKRWQNGNGYAGTYFWNAIRKYGWDGFSHEVIADGLSKREACEMEKALISQYKAQDKKYGYNIMEGGQTGDNLRPMHGKENFRAAAVKRIDEKTGEIKIYQTIHEAAVSMGINYRGISKACHGVSKTYKGYIWEYADKEFEKPFRYPRGKYPHVLGLKAVRLTEPDGTVQTFKSIKQAGGGGLIVFKCQTS